VLAGIFIGIFVVNLVLTHLLGGGIMHAPCSVEESDDVKLLWDFSVVTDRSIPANRPDIILVMKQCHRALLIDFACPADYNIRKLRRSQSIRTLCLKSSNCGMLNQKLFQLSLEH